MGKFVRSGDLFEDLKRWLGCEFVSDVKKEPFRHNAYHVLVTSAFTGYPLCQWKDLLKYFSFNDATVMTLKSEDEAKSFLTKRLR